MIYALTLLLSAVALLNYARFRDLLYPAFVHATIWAVLCGVLAIFEADFWRLSPLTLVTFGLGVLCFSLGCHLSTYGYRADRVGRREIVGVPSLVTTWGVVGLSLSIFPFFVARVVGLATNGPTESFYVNVRWMTSEGGESFGLSAYGSIISYTAVFVTLVRLLRAERSWADIAVFAVALVTAIGFAVLQTGRTALFMLLFVLFVPPVVVRYVRAGRASAALFGFMILFFGFFGVVIRSTTGPGSLLETVNGALVSLRHYFVGGAYAFDTLISTQSPLELGANTGRFFYAIARSIGYGVEVKPLVQEFSYPFATNVYTFYQPYFLDFDLAVAIGVQFVFGVLHGSFYRKVSRTRVRAVNLFVFSILAYPLFMQFFQDQYFNLLSTWVQLTLIGIGVFGVPPLLRRILRSMQAPAVVRAA